jgi:alcohol-forming fatty acyl-CoA reductase
MEQIIDMGKAIQDETPLDKMLWAPGGGLTHYKYLNFVKVIFLHILPAFLIDAALSFKGHKPL